MRNTDVSTKTVLDSMPNRRSFLIRVIIVISFALASVCAGSGEESDDARRIVPGIYGYNAYYETGAKARTWTKGHKVTVEKQDGQYFLVYFDEPSGQSMRLEAKQFAGGLLYEWTWEKEWGKGIYVFYEESKKFFGTFLIHDKEGEHTGYLEGWVVRRNPGPD